MTPIPRGIQSTRQHEPLPPEQEVFGEEGKPVKVDRNDRLEAEIVAVMAQLADRPVDLVAARILQIPRIRDALKLMDDVDSGMVELITYGSKPESSDAR